MPSRPIRADQRVQELAQLWPAALSAFEHLRIDYCCNGDRSLAAAAEAAGLDLDELMTLVADDDATPLRATSEPGFEALTLTQQVDHIAQVHHRFARRQLLRSERQLRQVRSGHSKIEGLGRIRSLIDDLLEDLLPHMAREERYLFPYMRSLEGNMKPDEQITLPIHGDLQYPLASISHDHADDSARLDELRALIDGYTRPANACAPVLALFGTLTELERDLREHIRIENEVVFPKAVGLERAARDRAVSGS
jgi:regulator of cell morphogenesis and NO signaling